MLLKFLLLLWLLLFVPNAVDPRGRPINLYDQPGNLHRGPGDIVNLWVGFNTPEGFRSDGPVERNAIKPNSQNRWTRYQNDRGQFVIPYIISGKFDTQEHATIARAMMAIAENTCIKFEKRGGEADYVDLKNERGEGCYTLVGRVPGKNTVMLETNEIATCLEFDIVIHELMHTIGLWHEQMRYDRDEFIKIHWENIGPEYVTQFVKVPDTDSTTYGVKYDYQSVMHYAKDAFASKPGKTTMETLDKQFQDVIGKVRDASSSDYLKICNIYACHTCMGRPFTPGQSRPVDGQRVITLGPGVVTLPTASPSPVTVPVWPPATTPRGPTKGTSPKPIPSLPPVTTPSSIGPAAFKEDSKEDEDRRVRPTPLLPIILPLINNNWWWKNTPAPPLRDPHGRMWKMSDDVGEGKVPFTNGTEGEVPPATVEGKKEEEKVEEEEEEEEEDGDEWREVPEGSAEEEEEETDMMKRLEAKLRGKGTNKKVAAIKEEEKVEEPKEEPLKKEEGDKKQEERLAEKMAEKMAIIKILEERLSGKKGGEEKRKVPTEEEAEEEEEEAEEVVENVRKKEEGEKIKLDRKEREKIQEEIRKLDWQIHKEKPPKASTEEEGTANTEESKAIVKVPNPPEPEDHCRGDDAAFCERLFNDGRRGQLAKSAVKACALGVIKRHCCRSCIRGEGHNELHHKGGNAIGQGNANENAGDGDIAKAGENAGEKKGEEDGNANENGNGNGNVNVQEKPEEEKPKEDSGDAEMKKAEGKRRKRKRKNTTKKRRAKAKKKHSKRRPTEEEAEEEEKEKKKQ